MAICDLDVRQKHEANHITVNPIKLHLPLLDEIRTPRYKYLCILTAVLLVGLRINHKVFTHTPGVWLIIPATITLALIGERYTDAENATDKLK